MVIDSTYLTFIDYCSHLKYFRSLLSIFFFFFFFIFTLSTIARLTPLPFPFSPPPAWWSSVCPSSFFYPSIHPSRAYQRSWSGQESLRLRGWSRTYNNQPASLWGKKWCVMRKTQSGHGSLRIRWMDLHTMPDIEDMWGSASRKVARQRRKEI